MLREALAGRHWSCGRWLRGAGFGLVGSPFPKVDVSVALWRSKAWLGQCTQSSLELSLQHMLGLNRGCGRNWCCEMMPREPLPLSQWMQSVWCCTMRGLWHGLCCGGFNDRGAWHV